MPERLKDKRRPFIFNLADIFLKPNSERISEVYDEADTYLFGKRKPREKSKDKE